MSSDEPPETDGLGAAEDAASLPESTTKRDRILRAAIKVFAQNGFYATKVSEIAQAAGVADGTIYLYFKNKEDVLISIFDDRMTRLVAFLERDLANRTNFDDRFRAIVELQLGLLFGQRDLAEVITVNLRQSSRLLKEYAAPLFNKYLDLIVKLVADAQRDNLIRADVRPRIVARAVWGSLDGIALTWALAEGNRDQLQKAASQVASLWLRALTIERP